MRLTASAAAGVLLAAGVGIAAHATPVTTNPGVLMANGDVKAVFAFADAGDESTLLKLSFAGVIFDNKTDAIGTTKDLGPNSGAITFVLNNLSQGYSFATGMADTGPGGDGFYHAIYTSDFSTLGDGALPTAAANAIAALGSPVTYVAFEDRRNGDYDYNDLVFAFTAIQPVAVPEPAVLAVMGAGVLGLGLARRRSAR